MGPQKNNNSIQQTMKKINQIPGVKNQDLLNKMLIDHFASKMNMKDFEFAIFCIAFLFEPGVKDGESNKKYEVCHYIPKCIPKSLPRYLEAFKASSTEIFDGPVSSECNGLGSDYGSHRFLLCEGKLTCKKCKADFCLLCYKDGYCNRCYSHSLFLEMVEGDEEAAENLFSKKNVKTASEMCNALIERGTQDVGSASLHELECMYDAIIDKEEIDFLRKQVKDVYYPMKTPGK